MLIEDELRRIREEKARIAQEAEISDQATHRVHVGKEQRELDVLNETVRAFLAPYVEIVRKSQCLEILRELVRVEKLSDQLRDRRLLAFPKVTFYISQDLLSDSGSPYYYRKYGGFELADRPIAFRNLPEKKECSNENLQKFMLSPDSIHFRNLSIAQGLDSEAQRQAVGLVSLEWNQTSSGTLLYGYDPHESCSGVYFSVTKGYGGFVLAAFSGMRDALGFHIRGTGVLRENDFNRETVESLVAMTYIEQAGR